MSKMNMKMHPSTGGVKMTAIFPQTLSEWVSKYSTMQQPTKRLCLIKLAGSHLFTSTAICYLAAIKAK